MKTAGIYLSFAKYIDNFFEEYEREHRFSGVLRVRLADEIICQKDVGMANYEKNVPFSVDSLFSFYSISKPFCAIGLMKLWDKGLVDLEAHPSKYVPEAERLNRDVTIRHLLQHVSGLPDFAQTTDFASKYAFEDYKHLREHLRLICDYRQLFQPGTSHFYANINYNILSLIIENVTQQVYGDYMQCEVFVPLGLSTMAQIDLPNLTIPHRVQGYQMENNLLMPVERDIKWMRGAGDVVGTADDVYCLNLAIKHRKLLSDEAWRNILTPSSVNSMGFGCFISECKGKTKIQHNGGSTGFRTLHIQLLQDDFDLILLSNFGFNDVRGDLIMAVDRFLTGFNVGKAIEMDKGYI